MSPGFARALLLASLLFAVGCGSGGSGASSSGDDTHGQTLDPNCSGDYDEYAPGLSKTTSPGDYTVSLVDANPAPPALGTNVWTLELEDAAGEPLRGASLTVTPWMPAHRHGTSEVVIEEQADGRYLLDPVELIMPGVWEVRVDVTPEGGEAGEALLHFCIPEL